MSIHGGLYIVYQVSLTSQDLEDKLESFFALSPNWLYLGDRGKAKRMKTWVKSKLEYLVSYSYVFVKFALSCVINSK